MAFCASSERIIWRIFSVARNIIFLWDTKVYPDILNIGLTSVMQNPVALSITSTVAAWTFQILVNSVIILKLLVLFSVLLTTHLLFPAPSSVFYLF